MVSIPFPNKRGEDASSASLRIVVKCPGCGSTSRHVHTARKRRKKKEKKYEKTEVPQTSDIYRSETRCTMLPASTTLQEHVMERGYREIGASRARARAWRSFLEAAPRGFLCNGLAR